MRIDTLSLKGLLRFTDVVTLPLRDLPPGLIAITGENGAGKTTLLEAFFGCIHRQWPSRDGELVHYATGRDSFIDAAFTVDGVGAFRARVNLDGPKRGTDAVLEAVQPDGSRIRLNDGKASTYDRAIAERFPSPALMLASSFSAQNKRGNFIGHKPKDRKDLFAELLGLQHYQAMSQTAGTCVARLDLALTRLQARHGVLEQDSSDRVVVELDRLANALQQQGGAAEVRKRELAASLRDCDDRLALHADSAAAFAAASQQIRTLEAELGARQQERAAIDTARRRAAEDLAAEDAAIAAKAEQDVTDAANKIRGNEQIQGMRQRITDAVAAVAVLDAMLVELRTRERTLQAEKDAATREKTTIERDLAGLDRDDRTLTRVRADAALLTTVPCGGDGLYAACQFLTNAQAALAQVADLEARLGAKPGIVARLAAAVAREDACTTHLVDVRRQIATGETDRAALATLTQYATALADSDARIAELTAGQAKARADAEAQRAAAAGRCEQRYATLDTQALTLDRTIARLLAARDTAQADLAAAESGHAEAVVLRTRLAAARAEWDTVIGTLARVGSAVAELARRRDEVAAALARLTDLDARIATAQRERGEWALLATALGRDGLPVLEIDAAGPTISAYTNELLAVCFGTRFTVDLITQQAKADGKGMKEAFTVAVLDNERGGDPVDVSDLSGGEKVIVTEALMSGIALYANQRAAVQVQTMWRDETTGDLDPKNAVRYIHMLRRLQQIAGVHQIFFISHNDACSALADAQIVVRKIGASSTATIALPPFASEAA